MEMLLQLAALIAAALLLTACAGLVPAEATHTASVEATSIEVSCMSECLEDGSETCDSCAEGCLQSAPDARGAAPEPGA